jgi:hypothetical protein
VPDFAYRVKVAIVLCEGEASDFCIAITKDISPNVTSAFQPATQMPFLLLLGPVPVTMSNFCFAWLLTAQITRGKRAVDGSEQRSERLVSMDCSPL